jgi:uncharacterized protein (UPF0276 family)
MNRFQLPYLGLGLGLRTAHYPYILEHFPQDIGWFEVISENFMESDGRPRHVLEQVRAHYDVVMHGVSLSIGSTDALDIAYLKKLKTLAEWLQPAWVSDHLCWTGVQGGNTHDLLPLPYTEEALAHVVERIKRVQDALGRPLLIENPSSYVRFADNTIPEAEFIARMSEAADCALLLDINNVVVSCFNHRQDCKAWLDTIPHDRVVQIHLAGHEDKGNHRIDTHNQPVPADVWCMYRYAIAKCGRVSTMVEWDADIPEFPVVLAEVMKAKQMEHARADLPNHLPDFSVKMPSTACASDGLQVRMQQMQSLIMMPDLPKNMSAYPWITAIPDFSPDEQMAVYQEGYALRLIEILANACPAWARYVGNEAAQRIMREYVYVHPSRYYNLNRYADDFPAFVAACPDMDAYATALARFEVSLDQLVDASHTPALTSDALAGIDEDAFMDMALQLRSQCQLHAFAVDVEAVYAYVMAIDDAAQLSMDEAVRASWQQPSWLAMFRDDAHVLYRLPLEAQEYALLLDIDSGEAVGDVLERHEKSVTPEQVQRWFSRWMSHQLFRSC